MKKDYGFNMEYSYRTLPNIFYDESRPSSAVTPSIVVFNDDLAKELDLDVESLSTNQGAAFLSGHHLSKNIKPLAMAYAGHQYGQFTVLGDGRATLLFEHKIKDESYDVHLKGSGETAYSRGFDGRATLRSALLEYLMSEAIQGLGIPTTRSLAVLRTGEKIQRMGLEEGAILVRTAKSHLRIGTFEYAIYKEDNKALKQLVEYAIKRHDSELEKQDDRYLKWFQNVVRRQAHLIAKWQQVGFVHGVMNTDNMTISGETIDYGPCAFMDTYSLKTVFSSIDSSGRYAYGRQPFIGSWNLAKLGQMILPLIDSDKTQSIHKVQNELSQYGNYFENDYYQGMLRKLGISDQKERDFELVDSLLKLMEAYKADYTNTFVALTKQEYSQSALFDSSAFKDWDKQWKERIKAEKDPFKTMHQANPFMIPRNHIVKKLLDDAAYREDLDSFKKYIGYLKNPYDYESIPDIYRSEPEESTSFVTYCGT